MKIEKLLATDFLFQKNICIDLRKNTIVRVFRKKVNRHIILLHEKGNLVTNQYINALFF